MIAYVIFFGLIFILCGWFVYEYHKLNKLEEKYAEQERLMREVYRLSEQNKPRYYYRSRAEKDEEDKGWR